MSESSKRYLLHLINPKRKYRYPWDLEEICIIIGRKTAIHPLSLPIVAALTPSNYDIKIIDKEPEPLKFDIKSDLDGNSKKLYKEIPTYLLPT